MFKRIKKSLLGLSITVFVMLNTTFAQTVPTPSNLSKPTVLTDIKWFKDGTTLLAFVMGAIIFVAVAVAGVKWGIARVKIGVEDDPAKIAEYESVIKKQIFNLLLALGGSIVTAMLAFFV